MTTMQQRIDQFDWSSTPIGPAESWPQSLRTSLSICLASRFPILIWWGPELIKLYNDAYAPIPGSKHPHALAVFETTERVVGERRLDTLRQLAARSMAAKTVEDACHNAAEILKANPKDVPFAAIHLPGRSSPAHTRTARSRASQLAAPAHAAQHTARLLAHRGRARRSGVRAGGSRAQR